MSLCITQRVLLEAAGYISPAVYQAPQCCFDAKTYPNSTLLLGWVRNLRTLLSLVAAIPLIPPHLVAAVGFGYDFSPHDDHLDHYQLDGRFDRTTTTLGVGCSSFFRINDLGRFSSGSRLRIPWLDERIYRTLCVLCFSKFVLFCKFHIVAVVLCFDSSVCVFYFILVDWTLANLPSGEPHLDLGG